MRTVILAGGRGTRLAEETSVRPKPMVEIGGRPLLWHIMKTYGDAGYREFIIALGYLGHVVKEYFLNYYHHQSDLTISLGDGQVTALGADRHDWVVHLLDTGERTLTGGRLYRLRDRLRSGPFMLTYGDGLANIDVAALVAFHRAHGRLATVTAVRPVARFGEMRCHGSEVVSFKEKPQTVEGWINGGFFVFEPRIFEYLTGDDSVLEGEPMERLAAERQLMAYRHEGFWQCVDTVRDREFLESEWATGQPRWLAPARTR